MGEERPWEKSYPAGVRWDAPVEMLPLPELFDRFTANGQQSPRSNIATARSPMPNCGPPLRKLLRV